MRPDGWLTGAVARTSSATTAPDSNATHAPATLKFVHDKPGMPESPPVAIPPAVDRLRVIPVPPTSMPRF